MEKDKSAKKIAIVGGGHIGSALAMGLVRSGKVAPSDLTVASPHLSRINHLKKLGIGVTTDNVAATADAEWVFLAVKPIQVPEVLKEIQDSMRKRLIISLAAGVAVETLRSHWKSSSVSFARIMPNMPIAHAQGVIGLFAGRIAMRDKSELKRLLQGLGFVLEVEEEREREILTVVSGSGPAVAASFMEAVSYGGRQLGLSKSTADALAANTFKGTALYLEAAKISPEALMEAVATKGGITEAILGSLKRSGVRQAIALALKSGYAKIRAIRN